MVRMFLEWLVVGAVSCFEKLGNKYVMNVNPRRLVIVGASKVPIKCIVHGLASPFYPTPIFCDYIGYHNRWRQ